MYEHGAARASPSGELAVNPVLSENSIRPTIRIARQNHCIIENDVCDPARAWNVRRRSIQVADGSLAVNVVEC
jgi:hypothetical protein